MDFVRANEVDRLGTWEYRYDGLGRLTNRAFTDANDVVEGQLFIYDAAGHIIVEQQYDASITLREKSAYLWSPVTGRLILRDRDTDADGGYEQRHLALTDQRGNIVAIADHASGEIVERQFFTPGGKVTQTTTDPDLDFRLGFRSGWLDNESGTAPASIDNVTIVGGQHYDYLTGDTFAINAQAYWADQTEIVAEDIGWWNKTVLVVAPIAIGAVVGVATGGLGFAAAGFFGGLSGGFASGFTNSYASGASAGEALESGAVNGAIGGVAGLAGGALVGRLGGSALSAASKGGASFGQYVTTGLARSAAIGAIDGGVSGAIDGGARAALHGGGFGDIVGGAVQGFGFGAVVGGFTGGATHVLGRSVGYAFRRVTAASTRGIVPDFGPNTLGAAQAPRYIAGYGWTDRAYWKLVGRLKVGESIEAPSLRVAARLRQDAFPNFTRSRYRGPLSNAPDLRGTYDWHNPGRMIHPGPHQTPHVQIKLQDGSVLRIEVRS